MKTYQLTGIRQMEMAEMPPPCVSKVSDVLLRVESVGVCGSDIHYYKSGRIGKQVVEYPFIVGHEFSATVVETGENVSRVPVGTRVAVDPAVSCGECDQCRVGRPHTCRNLKFMGCPKQLSGCLCEYVVLPESCCFPVSQKIGFDQAALIEPFSIGCYAVQQTEDLNGARIGILGAGPIGLSVLLAAKTQKPAGIYMTEPIPERRALAEEAGADWVGDPYAQDPAAAVAASEPRLLDVVFECCGRQEALDNALELLAPGGRLMLIGIPETDRISFAIDELRHREISIVNVRRQNDCVQTAIDLMETGAVDLDLMMTHHFPFSETPAAFELVESYADGVVKAMISMTPD